MSVSSLMLLVHTDLPMAPSTAPTQGPRLTEAPSDLLCILLLWLSLSFLKTSISVFLVHSLLLRAQHAKSIQSQLWDKWMLNTSVSHNHPSSPRASQESSFPTPGPFFPDSLWTPLMVPFSNCRPRLHREAFSDYLCDVNFMCHRDWVWDTQIFCPTLFWKYVCEGVLDESNSWTGRMNRADCPPQCGWASSNKLRTWTEEKSNFLRNKRTFKLTAVSWEISLSTFRL